jgi:Flp pilus assembly protein TadG
VRWSRNERGQSSVELAGIVFLVFVAGLFTLQAAIVGWTAVSAKNAARTAARMASRGGDGAGAAQNSLASKGLDDHAQIDVQGSTATVTVPWTQVIPGLGLLHLPPVQETARMPYTG